MTAAVMTYTSLCEDVQAYTERPTDSRLEDQLPRLIALAENTIAAALKVLGVQVVVDGECEQGNPVVDKPAYWRDTVSLMLRSPTTQRYTPLDMRPYEFCLVYWDDLSEEDVPIYYAELDNDHHHLCPTPNAAYELRLIYHPRVTPISAEHEVSWLTENAPQLLFSRVMMEAQLFLKNYTQADAWSARYEAALAELRNESTLRNTDRTEVGATR